MSIQSFPRFSCSHFLRLEISFESLVLAESLSESDSDETFDDASNAPDMDFEARRNHPSLRNKRKSVCAERLEDVSDMKLEVIKKSEEEAARIRKILEKNMLFNSLDDHQMKTIVDAMFVVEKEDSEVIIQQGEDGDNFYVIDSGHVDVYVDDETGRNLVQTYDGEGAFGELAIMYNSPRAATCIAKGNVRLWALDRLSYKVILMQTSIARRNAYRAFLEKVPSFLHLTEFELLTFADALDEEVFEDGAVVCREGESGNKFYVVKEGVAVCTKANSEGSDEEVAKLASGAYFGEIALLTEKPRQATVTAKGELRCLSLGRDTFNKIVGPLEEVLARNMSEY